MPQDFILNLRVFFFVLTTVINLQPTPLPLGRRLQTGPRCADPAGCRGRLRSLLRHCCFSGSGFPTDPAGCPPPWRWGFPPATLCEDIPTSWSGRETVRTQVRRRRGMDIHLVQQFAKKWQNNIVENQSGKLLFQKNAYLQVCDLSVEKRSHPDSVLLVFKIHFMVLFICQTSGNWWGWKEFHQLDLRTKQSLDDACCGGKYSPVCSVETLAFPFRYIS